MQNVHGDSSDVLQGRFSWSHTVPAPRDTAADNTSRKKKKKKKNENMMMTIIGSEYAADGRDHDDDDDDGDADYAEDERKAESSPTAFTALHFLAAWQQSKTGSSKTVGAYAALNPNRACSG